MPTSPHLMVEPNDVLAGTAYRVIQSLGKGGMGAVFECEHTRLLRRVCVKVVHPGLLGRQDLLDRMEIEARSLAKLDHRSIVRVFDMGVTDDGLPYFVMEKLEGKDLRCLLRSKRKLELDDAIAITVDILEALAHAHREGIVHRDIKPENVFVCEQDGESVAKVVDFGIAHVAADDRNLTGERFLGTSPYAAPEQLRGETPTHKTDLYAVGCLFFELVTGERPFRGPRLSDFYRQHVHEAAPRLRSRGGKVPRELDRLIGSALAKVPNDRPESALGFAAQLRRIRRDEIRARPDDSATVESLLTALATPQRAARLPSIAHTVHDETLVFYATTEDHETFDARDDGEPTHVARLAPKTMLLPEGLTVRPTLAPIPEPPLAATPLEDSGEPESAIMKYWPYVVAMFGGVALAVLGAMGWATLGR